jgi:ribosomal protein S18 acetylase RimI-like enzyme
MQIAPRPSVAVVPEKLASAVRLRSGMAGDAAFISWGLRGAAGGLYEQMLDGIVPGFDVETLLGFGIADPTGPFSVANAIIAEQDGVPLGMALAHPRAEPLVPSELLRLVPAERLAPLRPLIEPQDDGSLYVLGLMVTPDHARRGIATRLLRAVAERAVSQGLPWVTLHAWAGNMAAGNLYQGCGFGERERHVLPPSPWLASGGTMALLAADAGALAAIPDSLTDRGHA